MSEVVEDVGTLIVEGEAPNIDLETVFAPPNGEKDFLGPAVVTVSASLRSCIVFS